MQALLKQLKKEKIEAKSSSRILEKYSRDRSIYKIKPSLVVFPKKEKDIIKITRLAAKNKLTITARGGGTGLSGSAIGKGIIIDFSKYMNKIIKKGKTTITEPGILLKKLRPKIEKSGYMLPSVPLHGDCAIGGNVNTRSLGPRTLKYGTMHNQVSSLRGVLPNGEIIDTKFEKTIPIEIKNKILKLQSKIKKEKKLLKYLKNRPLSAGGYNLLALVNEKNIKDIVTHLIVGSVGTLLLLTEVRLSLPKLKPLNSIYLLHFRDLNLLQLSLNKIKKIKPASIEFVDRQTLNLWNKKYYHPKAQAAMILAFESKTKIPLNITKEILQIKEIPKKQQKHLWKSRAQALPSLEKSAKKIGLELPSGIDDTSINSKDFANIIKEIKIIEIETRTPIASFGHLGVGSIHLRPFIDMKKNKEKLDEIGIKVFNIVKKYNGTLVGEHNAGLCRSRYLKMESKTMYNYMAKVKSIFDPNNMLNPKVMFNLDHVTKNIP